MSAEPTRIHPGAKLPEMIPVRIEWLCEWLAKAEMMGGWRVLQKYENEAGRVGYLARMEANRQERAQFWEDSLRGELEGKK